jgi:selenocysteine-specific elongation factor
MRPIVIGTAGHIDHGKTALVKAITGIDPSRLREEKTRGITIDLGFAHRIVAARDGASLQLSFVDVPGHSAFIRNMLAGVGGIDIVLLVISAEEGVKPQTREHLAICSLLGIRRGIAVLSKADAVSSERLAVVREEVRVFLKGSFLEGGLESGPDWPLPTSAQTGDGLGELARASYRPCGPDRFPRRRRSGSPPHRSEFQHARLWHRCDRHSDGRHY